ncbi:peptide transporter 3-like isoform X3 [Rhodnius prolixus]|uniref:peptide transporter 3-like isoform X3 n=1 Tax=Rhodnius prolixus TaxID=13249 RepID=UPI003D187D48
MIFISELINSVKITIKDGEVQGQLRCRTKPTIFSGSFAQKMCFYPHPHFWSAIRCNDYKIAVLMVIFVFITGYSLMTSSTFFVNDLKFRFLPVISIYIFCIGCGSMRLFLHILAQDQLTTLSEEKYLTVFNIVSITSELFASITVPLLVGISYFGKKSGYQLPFCLTLVMILIGSGALLIGTKYYSKKIGSLKFISKFYHCSLYSLRKKLGAMCRDEDTVPWLNYAYKKYDHKFVKKVKDFYYVAPLLIPMPIFWALYDQQLTLFLFQAEIMDNRVFGYHLVPELIFVITSLFTAVMLPICLYAVFPFMNKLEHCKCLLDKMSVGFLLAVLSFAIATSLEGHIETSRVHKPGVFVGQISIINGINCTATVRMNTKYHYIEKIIKPFDKLTLNKLESSGVEFFESVTDVQCQERSYSVLYTFKIIERKCLSYLLKFGNKRTKYSGPHEDKSFKDINKSILRILYQLNESKSLHIEGPKDKKLLLDETENVISGMHIDSGNYDIYLNGEVKLNNASLGIGGVYTLLVVDYNNNTEVKLFTFVEPNYVHMLWLIPQMLLMLSAEVFITHNCLAYVFHKAEEEMKFIVISFWLIMCGLGNFIVALNGVATFSSKRILYILLKYTCMMIFCTAAQIFISANYDCIVSHYI